MSESSTPEGPNRIVARCRVRMLPETVRKVVANALKKGDVLEVARFAAIRATHSSANLLPDLNQLRDSVVTVDFEVSPGHIDAEVVIVSSDGTVRSTYASAGALVAALTIYDMCKAIDHSMVIEDLSKYQPRD